MKLLDNIIYILEYNNKYGILENDDFNLKVFNNINDFTLSQKFFKENILVNEKLKNLSFDDYYSYINNFNYLGDIKLFNLIKELIKIYNLKIIDLNYNNIYIFNEIQKIIDKFTLSLKIIDLNYNNIYIFNEIQKIIDKFSLLSSNLKYITFNYSVINNIINNFKFLNNIEVKHKNFFTETNLIIEKFTNILK